MVVSVPWKRNRLPTRKVRKGLFMFYTNTFVGGEVNVVGESERRRRRETRNKKKQGPGVFHQVPIATPVHVGKFERQGFILRINLGGIGSALVCAHSNRPCPPILPHLKYLSHSPSSLSLSLILRPAFINSSFTTNLHTLHTVATSWYTMVLLCIYLP